MDRRHFIAALAGTAAGLFLPYEPRRVYSFGSAVGVVEVPRITIFKGLTPGPTSSRVLESETDRRRRHRAGRFSLEEIFAARERFAVEKPGA